MIHLKRASAGSGKTYELTKTFIKNLITTKKQGKRRQLRKDPALLREALNGIMAVTFTVKATAEMKQRIVEKLAALAMADDLPEEKAFEIDYLKEFMEEYKASREEIAYMAKEALRTLLLHFSEFKVQTIDSFFQGILHLFTYEASIDDNFNMEIDTDYVSTVGLDAALDSIAADGGAASTGETLQWLKMLMDDRRKSNKWNVFSRSENEKSLYRTLIHEAKNLEKEDFQKKRSALENYFKTLERPFIEVVKEIDHTNTQRFRSLYENRKRDAEFLLEELKRAGLGAADIAGRSGPKALRESCEPFDEERLSLPSEVKPRKAASGFSLKEDSVKKIKGPSADSSISANIINDIDRAFTNWVSSHSLLREEFMNEGQRLYTWLEYRRLLPQLMVVMEISRQKRNYLESTNSLVISETTHILSRIIGQDETPFVYEKMGSRINHYLIDEFQDTSRMQWRNLRPLIAESESRDEDNLIIGDPKQSIYRFRNADYRLISEDVEKEFHNVKPYTGDEPPADYSKENTNYRSKKRIIEFNNYLFSNIVNIETRGSRDSSSQPLFTDRIKRIYADSVQALPEKTQREDLGYVNITLYPPLDNEEKEKYEKAGEESLGEPGIQALPSLILQLKERGYDFRDIGVLVKKGDQARASVKVITDYNSIHPETPIPVISDENLLVSSSLSVRIILHALQIMTKGLKKSPPQNETLKEPVDEGRLFDLLHSLQSMALTSLTEAIAAEFVPEKLRNREAPFIAAFQDAVADYCSGHTSDIGSFLNWWKRKSATLSINSPEESDGVRILTIHKSKGLEYKCVIIPKLNIHFVPMGHPEWKWISPSHDIKDFELLPPFLPLETSRRLEKTVHGDIWSTFLEEVSLDELNKLYVGLTRAIDELYVFVPDSSKTHKKSLSSVLLNVFDEDKECDLPFTLTKETSEEGKNTTVIAYGEPLPEDAVRRGKRERNKKGEVLDRYEICADRKVLRFQDGNRLVETAVTEGDGLRQDPRAEGTVKHRVMQMIRTPDDLDKALLEMKVSGLLSARQVEALKPQLKEAIGSVKDYGWFDESNRILNERTLLRTGEENYRPDRMVLMPGDKAVIIDYKFGNKESSYKKQIKEYGDRLSATGRFRSVEGYLWYLSLNEIERVL